MNHVHTHTHKELSQTIPVTHATVAEWVGAPVRICNRPKVLPLIATSPGAEAHGERVGEEGKSPRSLSVFPSRPNHVQLLGEKQILVEDVKTSP